jgi:hypothetical protein
MAPSTERIVTCIRCGKQVVGNRNTKYCRDCNKEIRREYGRNYYNKYEKVGDKPDSVVKIVYDPDPEGGFHPGAEFKGEHHKLNIASGVYTNGTVIAIDGKKKQIIYIGGVARQRDIA